MGERKYPQTYQELAKAFLELFDETGPRDLEEVDAILLEAGFDPKEVGFRFRTMAEQTLSTSPLNWRVSAERDLQIERSQIEGDGTTKELSRDDIISRIQGLLTKLASAPKLVTAHRNLEQASDEDLGSLLDELEYLTSHQRQSSDYNED